jgi:hypothetical protein
MRPLTILLGITMGSTVSLAFCLLLVWVVFLLLGHSAEQHGPEKGVLLKAIAVFTLFSVASSASFYGDLRASRWRVLAHLATLAMFGVTIAVYWPR